MRSADLLIQEAGYEEEIAKHFEATTWDPNFVIVPVGMKRQVGDQYFEEDGRYIWVDVTQEICDPNRVIEPSWSVVRRKKENGLEIVKVKE